jgi:sulfite exporter TauE/SafE
MNDTVWPLFGALMLTGLAGSLHCIGMCGPVLLGLSRRIPQGRSFGSDALAYHLGRLWTYVLLGLIAGAFGLRLEQTWGGRRAFAFALGAVVVLNGLLLLRRKGSRVETWLASRLGALLRTVMTGTGLAGRRGFIARVLVGAVMGLTPCGMVWMALIPAAALGHPLLSGLGMLCFGLGTLPALSSVVLLDRLMTQRFRRHGRTFAAIALILAGVWLFARALPTGGGTHGSHHEHTAAG